MNPSTCVCENDKYAKIISDDSKIVCDEIISVTDIVSTKIDFYIVQSFISDHIAIDNYHFLLSLCIT